MRLLSETVAEPLDFFSVVRALDHIQKRGTSHLLTSHDVERGLGLLAYFGPFSPRIDVEVYGGYSGPGQKWPSVCSVLRTSKYTNEEGGVYYYSIVSRREAPQGLHFHGPRFIVKVVRPPFERLRVPAQFVGPVRDAVDPDIYIYKSLILS